MAVNKIPEDLHTQLLTASKFLMSFNRGIIPVNSSLMQFYCDGNVSDHIARVKYLTIWGTHVELVAAAFLLKMTTPNQSTQDTASASPHKSTTPMKDSV